MRWLLSFLVVLSFSTLSFAQDVLLPIRTDKGIGFINQTGKLIIKPKYDDSHGFIDYRGGQYKSAAVKVGSRWGLIDRKGNYIVKPHFEHMYAPTEGMMPVKLDGKWGAINEKGKMVVTPVYESISPFDGGYAGVGLSGKDHVAYVNKHGQLIIPKEHPEPSNSTVRLKIKAGNKFGYMRWSGFVRQPE